MAKPPANQLNWRIKLSLRGDSSAERGFIAFKYWYGTINWRLNPSSNVLSPAYIFASLVGAARYRILRDSIVRQRKMWRNQSLRARARDMQQCSAPSGRSVFLDPYSTKPIERRIGVMEGSDMGKAELRDERKL